MGSWRSAVFAVVWILDNRTAAQCEMSKIAPKAVQSSTTYLKTQFINLSLSFLYEKKIDYNNWRRLRLMSESANCPVSSDYMLGIFLDRSLMIFHRVGEHHLDLLLPAQPARHPDTQAPSMSDFFQAGYVAFLGMQ